MLFSICSHEEFAWGQSLLKQLLSLPSNCPFVCCTNLDMAVTVAPTDFISALLYQLLWFTAAVPTASLSAVPTIMCCCRYQLWSNAVPYQPPVYQASSADTDAEPSMRADTQRIEIKIWAVSSKASWGSHELLDHPCSLNSPGKECPVSLQIRHRGHQRPLPCYTISPLSDRRLLRRCWSKIETSS